MAMDNKELIEYVNARLSEISSLSKDTTKTAADFEAIFDDIYANLPTNDASAKSALDRVNKAKQNLFKSRTDLFQDAESKKSIEDKYSKAKEERLNGNKTSTLSDVEQTNDDAQPTVDDNAQPAPDNAQPTIDDNAQPAPDNAQPTVDDNAQPTVDDNAQPAPVVENESEVEFVDYEDVTNEGEEAEEPQNEGEEVEEPQNEGEEAEEPQNEGEEVEKSTFDKIKEIANNLIMKNEETGQEQRVSEFGDDIIEKAANLYDKYPSTKDLEELTKKLEGGDFTDFEGVEQKDIVNVLLTARLYASFVETTSRGMEDNVLDSVTPTEKELETLSFIENKAPKKSLRQAVESKNPEVALMSVEDTLVANKYFVTDNKNEEDKAKCKEVIDGVMKHHLENIIRDGKQITPDNAVALMAICANCNDPALKSLVDDAKRAIQDALREYDREHFGGLSADQLAKNYADLQKDAKKFDPFTMEKSEGDAIDLSTMVFTDKNGNIITNKKEIEKYKDSIVSVAREQACQSLVKKGDYSPEELNGAIKDATFRIITSSSPVSKDGVCAVNVDNLAASIANPQVENETFKNRVWQKFKNTKFAKAVKKCVDGVDKKLTERFGDKYLKAKKVVKFLGKTTANVAKNAALYAAAGLVPGGTAVLMGYNLYKSWKAVGPQLKDKDKSWGQKVGIIAATGITSALTLTGMGAGLGLNAQNLADSGIISPEAIGATMTGIGRASRMAIVTGAAMLPNALESASLKFKQMKLNRALKNVENLKDKDGKPLSDEEKAQRISEIMKEQKLLKAKQNANLKEMATKGVGVLGGMACAQLISPMINEQVHEMAEKAEATLDAAKSTAQGKYDFSDRPSPLLPEENDKFDPKAKWAEMEDKFGFFDRDGDGKVDTPWSKEAVEAREAASSENNQRVPDDVAGKLEADYKANLDEAKVAGSSGLGNESSYDHTLRHLENLNDSRIENNAQMAEDLCEKFGDKANLATIACKMSPYALQDALDLDLPDGVKPTSYQMLNYIAEHDLTPEQQAKFDQYIEKNFDGTRFKTENFPDWNKPAPQQVHTEPQVKTEPTSREFEGNKIAEATPDEKVVKIKIEVMNNTTAPQEHTVIEQAVYNNAYEGMTRQDIYAMERGYVPCPEFARGLDIDGSANGTFKGYHPMAYINVQTGKVMYLPQDMTTDMDRAREVTIGNAKDMMRMASQGYGDHMYNNRNGSYYGYGTRHMYPGGLGPGGAEVAYEPTREQKFWNTLGKINAVSQTVTGVAHDVSHVSHDISHVIHDIKGWGGRH